LTLEDVEHLLAFVEDQMRGALEAGVQFTRLVPRRPRSGRLEGWGGPMVRDAALRAAPHHEAVRALRVCRMFHPDRLLRSLGAECARVFIPGSGPTKGPAVFSPRE
jgi:hypothetical protein